MSPKISKTKRAGLTFSVSRIKNKLKKGNYSKTIGFGGPIFLAGVLEYLVAELVELAGNACRDNNKMRITPRHLQLAVRNDSEFDKLFQNVTISQGGVLPNIHTILMKRKSVKTPKTAAPVAPVASTQEEEVELDSI